MTKDEVSNLDDLSMVLSVNGEVAQSGSTKTMVFDVAYLVSYISGFMKLMPGDVITTGTPPGVGMGMNPPRFLNPADIMTLEVQGLGVQMQRVIGSE